MKVKSLILCILVYNFPVTLSSPGDQSPFYQNCLLKCTNLNCKDDRKGFLKEATILQDPWSYVVGWNCRDECKYECIWKTVQAFRDRGYPIVKFHGKWPFKRMFGLQEPASSLCSLLNLVAHLYMWRKFHKRINCNADANWNLIIFWNIFFAVCVNGWIWSTVFHARDTPATEFADYAGAFSMVMALFIASVVRAFYVAPRIRWPVVIVSLIYFAEHVRYLHSGVIDYDHNMIVNIIFGSSASVLWVVWSVSQLRKAGKAVTYVWRLQAFVVLSGAALYLELWDFPPYRFTWDTHALFHLATAPLPLLFYRFVMDDIEYLNVLAAQQKTGLKLA